MTDDEDSEILQLASCRKTDATPEEGSGMSSG